MLTPLLSALLLAPVAEAACNPRTTSQEVRDVSDLALRAYAKQEMSAWHRAVAEGTHRVTCLGEPLLPESAARWYTVLAVQGFLDRAPLDQLTERFQIVRGLDPTMELDPAVAPPGHPLRVAWDQALAGLPFGERPLEGPVRGELFVDGLMRDALPAGRPYIAQLVTPEGTARRTWFVEDSQDPPACLIGRCRLVWSNGLLLSSLGSAALAGGLWIAAGSSVHDFNVQSEDIFHSDGPATASERARFEATVQRANALGVAAEVSTGLAVGLGVLGVAVRF